MMRVSGLAVNWVQPESTVPPPAPPPLVAPLLTAIATQGVKAEAPTALKACTRYWKVPFPELSTRAVTPAPTVAGPLTKAGLRSIRNPLSLLETSVHESIARPPPMSAAAAPLGAAGGCGGGRLPPPPEAGTVITVQAV